MVDIRDRLNRVDAIMGQGELGFADDTELDESAHHYFDGKNYYADSDFLNATQNILPGMELKHMGFGEFSLEGSAGRIEFDRMRGKKFPGQVGRSHQIYDNKGGKLVKRMIQAMEKKGKSELVKEDVELDEATGGYKVGDKVLYGSVRGTIEDVKGGKYGIRLENGNFKWAKEGQLRKMPGREAGRFRSSQREDVELDEAGYASAPGEQTVILNVAHVNTPKAAMEKAQEYAATRMFRVRPKSVKAIKAVKVSSGRWSVSVKVVHGVSEDVELDEAKKSYHVRVTKYFRGIGDQGRIVKAGSEKEAIKIAAKMMKKKPSYLEAELV